MNKISTRKSLKKISSKVDKLLREEFKVIWQFFINNFFAYLLLYAQNVLINRFMPLEALGQYSYVQSVLALLISVCSMEIYSSYLRFVGFYSEKSLIKSVRVILAIASLLFILLSFIRFKEPMYILLFGSMWMSERLYFFRAKTHIRTYGRIKLTHYAIVLMALIALIVTNCLNEKTVLLAIGSSYCIVALFYTFPCKAESSTGSKDELMVVKASELVKYALPLSFNAIVVWLLGAADQMLINKCLDATTLTYYSVGFRIITVIRIGTGIIMEYWPRFYFEKMENKQYELMKILYKIFIFIVMLLCVGTIMFSKYIYIIMGASSYLDYRWMFCVLALSEMFRQWGAINMTYQSYVKNNIINVVILTVLGVIKLGTNWLCITSYGVVILLKSTLICYILYFILSLYFGYYKELRCINKARENKTSG